VVEGAVVVATVLLAAAAFGPVSGVVRTTPLSWEAAVVTSLLAVVPAAVVSGVAALGRRRSVARTSDLGGANDDLGL